MALGPGRARSSRSRIAFDMFDLARSAQEAKAAVKLRSLYHRGQDLAWDGQAVLAELVQKHGGVHVTPAQREALGKIFDVILWGELAAWRISAQLADQIEELEPKMAATAQAHDEARHFYVMYDYLVAMGHKPAPMEPASRRLLEHVLATESLAEKLMGMQLQIEALALTLFQVVREHKVEPVLTELLRYFEKDEARHVGLGVQYLPSLLRPMGKVEAARLVWFQMKTIGWSLKSLKAVEGSLRVLGIDPRRILVLGRAKQTIALQQLSEHMGIPDVPRHRELLMRAVNVASRGLFPLEGDKKDPLSLLRQARDAWEGDIFEGVAETSIDPSESTAS